ncbi:unnamed protein product, partial [Ectocarpus sp. 12 AP-2014]
MSAARASLLACSLAMAIMESSVDTRRSREPPGDRASSWAGGCCPGRPWCSSSLASTPPAFASDPEEAPGDALPLLTVVPSAGSGGAPMELLLPVPPPAEAFSSTAGGPRTFSVCPAARGPSSVSTSVASVSEPESPSPSAAVAA